MVKIKTIKMFNIILSFYTHAQTHTKQEKNCRIGISKKKYPATRSNDNSTRKQPKQQIHPQFTNKQFHTITPKNGKSKKNTKRREKCEHLI